MFVCPFTADNCLLVTMGNASPAIHHLRLRRLLYQKKLCLSSGEKIKLRNSKEQTVKHYFSHYGNRKMSVLDSLRFS